MYEDGELVVDVPTAAKALGLGRNLAYDAARDRTLPGAIRIGGRWVVSIPALLQALGAINEPEMTSAPATDAGAN
jgi:predicted DNA-binding transcriptional regulator AlpA